MSLLGHTTQNLTSEITELVLQKQLKLAEMKQIKSLKVRETFPATVQYENPVVHKNLQDLPAC